MSVDDKSYVCELNSTLEYVEKEPEKLCTAADAKINILHQEIIALHRILGSEYAEQCSDDKASHLSLINLDNLRNDLVLLQQAGNNRWHQAELYIIQLNNEAYQARKALRYAEKRANEEMYNSKRMQTEHKELAHGNKIHRDRIQALEANIREIKTDESTKEALQQKIVHLNNKIAKYTEVIGQMKQNSAKLQTAISVLEENLRKEKRARESLEKKQGNVQGENGKHYKKYKYLYTHTEITNRTLSELMKKLKIMSAITILISNAKKYNAIFFGVQILLSCGCNSLQRTCQDLCMLLVARP